MRNNDRREVSLLTILYMMLSVVLQYASLCQSITQLQVFDRSQIDLTNVQNCKQVLAGISLIAIWTMAETNPWRPTRGPLEHEMTGMSQQELNERAERMNATIDCLNRPVTPPPFPDNLPARRSEKARTSWYVWVLIALATVIILLIVGLFVWLHFLHLYQPMVSNPSPQIEVAVSTSILTSLAAHTTAFTLTATATLTHNATTTILSTSTVTETAKAPGPVCNPDTAVGFQAAGSGCWWVTCANSTWGHVNDPTAPQCKDWCALNPFCAVEWGKEGDNTIDMASGAVGCCGTCGCFQQKRPNDVMKWPPIQTATGIGARVV